MYTLLRADEMCLSFYATQRFALMYIYAHGLLQYLQLFFKNIYRFLSPHAVGAF